VIARTIATNPVMLLTDEPTGALDSRSTAEVLALPSVAPTRPASRRPHRRPREIDERERTPRRTRAPAHRRFGWPATLSDTDNVPAGPDTRIVEQKG
jgi:hypothetical protein